MTVKELIEALSDCDSDAKIRIMQEEELECTPEWWNDDICKPGGKATELFSEDLHSHYFYLLAIAGK